MKVCYRPRGRYGARDSTLKLVAHANEILDEYRAQGLDLTLRQLFYQFVSRDWIKNTHREYQRMGERIGDARLAGEIDWHSIVDRGCEVRAYELSTGPAQAVGDLATYYSIDKWADQANRIEVWIEKDSLVAIVEHACSPMQVPFVALGGSPSLTMLWQAAMRYSDDRPTTILYLGDHDPTGINMDRTIDKQLREFNCVNYELKRIALTLDQVFEHDPPPNTAKETDPRYPAYVAEFGSECWELDALSPDVLIDLIQTNIEAHRDPDLWDQATEHEQADRSRLNEFARTFEA